MTTEFDFQLAKTLQHAPSAKNLHHLPAAHLPPVRRSMVLACLQRSTLWWLFTDQEMSGRLAVFYLASRRQILAPIECCASKDSYTRDICRLSTAPEILGHSRLRRKTGESSAYAWYTGSKDAGLDLRHL